MTKIELYLYDEQEVAWFAQFHGALIGRRRAQQEQMAAQPGQRVPEIDAPPAPASTSEPESAPEPEPQVVGHIPAAAPTLAELIAAAQTYLTGTPVPEAVRKAKDLLSEYGAKTLSEVPEEKRAELIGRMK